MYETRIDQIRKLVALFVVIFGVGLAVSVNYAYKSAAAWFALGFLLCILTTIALVLEYLLRTWLRRRKNLPTRNQFTIAGMLLLTMYVGIACAIFRIIGPASFILAAVFGVIIAAVVAAPILEVIHRSKNNTD